VARSIEPQSTMAEAAQQFGRQIDNHRHLLRQGLVEKGAEQKTAPPGFTKSEL
jgi:transposase-like protein